MKKDPRPKQLKAFAIGLPLLLLFFAWRHYVKIGPDAWTLGCVVLAGGSIVISLFFRNIFERFLDGWMKVAGAIGFCVTTLLLTILYYGLFTPFAIIIRLSGKDFMARRLDGRLPSYWIKCAQEVKPKDRYLQQF
jgi:hypothetical protein